MTAPGIAQELPRNCSGAAQEQPRTCPVARGLRGELPRSCPGPAEELPRSFPGAAQDQRSSCLPSSCQVLPTLCPEAPQEVSSSCPEEGPAGFLGKTDVKANCVHVAQNMSHVLADSSGQEEVAHLQMALEEGRVLFHHSLCPRYM